MLLWASPDTTAVSSLTRVILIGAGLGLSLPALIALLVEQFPHYRWGLIAAIYMAVTMLGGTGMQALASAFLSASGYRASSSSQAASVHSLLTSTWSVLSLILTGVALTVGVFIFALRRKPLEQPYPEPGEGMC
jgi:MFS family permease